LESAAASRFARIKKFFWLDPATETPTVVIPIGKLFAQRLAGAFDMSTFTVNGSAPEAQKGPQTWGELLTNLEHGAGPGRTVVAAVRFAGVEQPTFRDPRVLATSLNAAVPIDVELSTTQELVDSARQSVLDGLEALVAAARDTADAFRLHELSRAHGGLSDFVSTFQLLTTLSAAVGRADAVSGDPDAATRGAEVLDRLQTSLGALIDYDVNEDWLSVAYVLEYEIAELLPMWGEAVSAADRRIGMLTVESAAGARS
jgi:hypothetical protein